MKYNALGRFVNNSSQIGCVEGTSEDESKESVEEYYEMLGVIKTRFLEEAVNYHYEFGVGLEAEVKIPVIGEAEVGFKVLTINWDKGANQPYATFGEASLMAQLGNGEDGALKTGVEYRNVLGDKNDFDLAFLSKDLYKDSIGLDIDGNILEDIKNTLENINIGIGAGVYVFVGGAVSVGVEPVTTYQIIYEELSEYGYIK